MNIDPFIDCAWCCRELHIDDLCGSDDEPLCSRCCFVTHGREAHA